ncbi:hypothetical protein HB364_23700 [Pseudoflavitalea sp. X16]|uniref:hypothetical protein n=1 Tax=Paraflavitalea devenefica TaxID=2716334 RepID=UPI00142316A1|nr:hypothetical protein [Paraflavitalea devenefica]NII28108.1 hypothetical protein [Paraflavitalea devenefica]
MAKQLGPIFLECTFDDLTFYKMDGKYYARKKSRLTREKVLKHPAFENTRFYAGQLACASQIASSIYKELPLYWRQFWMYRSFTGEALTMLNTGYTAQDAYTNLWKTYVEYWVLCQQKTGIPLKTGRKDKPFRRGKTYKTRLKHRTSNSQCRRYGKILGKNHWKSSYDHAAGLLEQEKKHLARQAKLAWMEEQKFKERRKEQDLAATVPRPPKPRRRWLAKEAERWRIMQASALAPPQKAA